MEHWIRAKYDWKEFHRDVCQMPIYIKGIYDGVLISTRSCSHRCRNLTKVNNSFYFSDKYNNQAIFVVLFATEILCNNCPIYYDFGPNFTHGVFLLHFIIAGVKSGTLFKKGKDREVWAPRHFFLDRLHKSVCYFEKANIEVR